MRSWFLVFEYQWNIYITPFDIPPPPVFLLHFFRLFQFLCVDVVFVGANFRNFMPIHWKAILQRSSLQNRRDFCVFQGNRGENEASLRRARVACKGILPSHATQASRSPRFRLCSPEKKITPVLQASSAILAPLVCGPQCNCRFGVQLQSQAKGY